VRPAPNLGPHFPLSVAVFTESVWQEAVSACRIHATALTIDAMDVVAILLGVLMFLVLIALIYGIDAI
jgi:hypothetical protein